MAAILDPPSYFILFFFKLIENITYKYKIKPANLRDTYIQVKFTR